MLKKFFILLILILMSEISSAQEYGWVKLTSPTSGNLRRIYVSDGEVWLLSDKIIYYSSNYPYLQFVQSFTSSTTFCDMTFINQSETKYGWIVGYASMGARTTHTSATVWTDMYLSGDLTFSCVSFPNTSIGFACGSDGRLHKTLDGGSNWADVGVSISNGSINTISFTDSTTGYLGGSAPAFKKTTDGGLTWINISGYTGTINDIYFYDSMHGWAVGASDILYYNGSLWTRIANSLEYNLNSVFFINANEGWIAGNGGIIIHSTDGGVTWSKQESGTTVTLRDIFFTSPTDGYVVGNSGTILHYTQLTSVEEQSNQQATFSLEQNQPNPFNPITKIEYSLSVPGHVTLSVYNILGQKVAELVDETKIAGRFNADFNGAELPSGIYYYSLQFGNKNETRKMMLIK